MSQQLTERGFGYGFGHLSPDQSKFLISIPKNASSTLSEWVSANGWTAAIVGDNCNWNSVQEMIVVLRDPVDRWISGIVQYIYTYILCVHGPNSIKLVHETSTEFDYDMSVKQFIEQYNQLSERILFDVINRFDDHVWPQTELFQNLLPTVPRKFFYLDLNFDSKISQHLDLDLNNMLHHNTSDKNITKKSLQEFIQQRLIHRPELKQRVINAYAKDYELINQIIQ
jgi:hypothetical protein